MENVKNEDEYNKRFNFFIVVEDVENLEKTIKRCIKHYEELFYDNKQKLKIKGISFDIDKEEGQIVIKFTCFCLNENDLKGDKNGK